MSHIQSDIDVDKLEKEIDSLTIEFGCEYCQHFLKLGDTDFNKLSSDHVLKTMRNMTPNLDTSRFYGTRVVFRVIRVWLVDNDFQQHTTSIPNGLMVRYITECLTNGRSRLSKEIGGNVNNVLPVWGSTRAPPREDRRSYAGKSSDNFHHKWVDMLNTRYSFQWDLQTVPSQIQVDGSGDIPESVQTTSLKKVSQLEELCEDKTKLLVVHNFAVVILFCTWTCM